VEAQNPPVAQSERPMPPMNQMPPTPPPPSLQKPLYDAHTFNQQIEQEQKIMSLIQELKKRKEESISYQGSGNSDNLSYFDKLSNKKKDLGRLIQFALIVVLGLSIHYMIYHYLSSYITQHDMSAERQFVIRLLYPLAVIFVLWNLKVFIK
jgi:hypothetical protein